MMLSTEQLRTTVIRETLDFLDDWSTASENLLLATATQEPPPDSQSEHRLGLYQISSEAHQMVWDTYLIDHPNLASRIRGLAGQRSFLRNPHGELVTNLGYATAIAWLIYKSNSNTLPATNDATSMAQLWLCNFCDKATSLDAFIKNYVNCATQGKFAMA